MVKCVCYRVPLPDEDEDEEEDLEKEEEEKKKLSPNLNVTGSPNQVLLDFAMLAFTLAIGASQTSFITELTSS